MRILKPSVAAATLIVGYDMLADDIDRVVGYDRIVVAYGLTGGVAAGDAIVELRVAGKKKASLINTGTGVAVTRDHMLADRIVVPRDTQLEAICTDAGNTNPYTLCIVTIP